MNDGKKSQVQIDIQRIQWMSRIIAQMDAGSIPAAHAFALAANDFTRAALRTIKRQAKEITRLKHESGQS